MNYTDFCKTLDQQISHARVVRQMYNNREEAAKALLFHNRVLSQEDKDKEYQQYLSLVQQAEDDLLKVSIHGRKTFDQALDCPSHASLSKALHTELVKMLRREEAQEISEYRLPERTLGSLRRLQNESFYDYDDLFTQKELSNLLVSITLSNGMYDAAKGLLDIDNRDEFIRCSKRLRKNDSHSEKDRRLYLSAILINMRSRGLLPQELEVTYEGQPLLSDKALIMMFMCADEHMQSFAEARKPNLDWGTLFDNLITIAGVTAPTIVIPVVLGICIIESIFPLLLTLIVAAFCILFELLFIWIIYDQVVSIHAVLHPEQTELDYLAEAYHKEMSCMARSLFNARRSDLNAVAAYTRSKAKELDLDDCHQHKQKQHHIERRYAQE